jgi:hypothetical protein
LKVVKSGTFFFGGVGVTIGRTFSVSFRLNV